MITQETRNSTYGRFAAKITRCVPKSSQLKGCPNDELLGPPSQEETVGECVRELQLLLGGFHLDNFLTPCCMNGSRGETCVGTHVGMR